MTTPQEAAAQCLYAARRAGRPGGRLPEACRPADVETAWAIQRRVDELVGRPLGGWKCGLPTATRPLLAAPIPVPAIVRAVPVAVPVVAGNARIEPEIAFVLGRDLPPRATPYTEAELRGAVRETRLVLELIASRYADPAGVTWPELLADHVSNYGLFVGPTAIGGVGAPLAHFEVEITGPDGTLLAVDGIHPDGHPLRPLAWLANFLADRGLMLRSGQIVTTGSYAGLVEVPAGVPLAVRFGDLGTLAVEFAAA
jgi:2-keto-4-pentenoate hydratase